MYVAILGPEIATLIHVYGSSASIVVHLGDLQSPSSSQCGTATKKQQNVRN
jgi:hypothetical protein